MKLKKILAVGLAATMVLGSSVTAFADEGTGTGTGKLEGTVNTEVFSVVLPTVADDGSTLAFTLDPEGLISKTSSAAYSGATFGDGTLFFNNVEAGAANDYSNTSDTLTIVNKSSVAADVTVTAKITNNTGIGLSADKTFADDTTASMYMAIIDDNNADGVAIEDESGATVTATIAAAADGAYEYSWSADDGYKYELKADADDTLFSKYEFKLTGAANAAGDWSALADVAPQVELVWNVVAHSDAIFTAGGTVGTITYKTDSITSVSKIEMTNTYGTYDALATNVSAYTAATLTVDDDTTTITFSSKYSSYYSGNVEATITYVDTNGDTQTEKLTLNMG